jgi:hypothetical protein
MAYSHIHDSIFCVVRARVLHVRGNKSKRINKENMNENKSLSKQEQEHVIVWVWG